MSELTRIFLVFFAPLALAILCQWLLFRSERKAMQTINLQSDIAARLRSLPVMSGRRWQVVSPLMTLIRCQDEWRYNIPISVGAVLEFCGWAGIDRGEPMASFMSPDLPDWIVFIPVNKLSQWCREISPQSAVKVRIVGDDCGHGEG